ncbi:MAG: TnsA endonuclease N-terminal domain-containing protein [Phycisphaerae bacterium]
MGSPEFPKPIKFYVTGTEYVIYSAMLEEYPYRGRRFTHYNGREPWYPIQYLDFAYQVKTPTGKKYRARLPARGEGKIYWHGHKVETGAFWSAKNKMSLRYRSRRERLWYVALESDASVFHYYVEPVRIHYALANRSHVYVPDLLIHHVDGRVVLVEIKLEIDRHEPINEAKFEAARKWCAAKGMTFEIWT